MNANYYSYHNWITQKNIGSMDLLNISKDSLPYFTHFDLQKKQVLNSKTLKFTPCILVYKEKTNNMEIITLQEENLSILFSNEIKNNIDTDIKKKIYNKKEYKLTCSYQSELLNLLTYAFSDKKEIEKSKGESLSVLNVTKPFQIDVFIEPSDVKELTTFINNAFSNTKNKKCFIKIDTFTDKHLDLIRRLYCPYKFHYGTPPIPNTDPFFDFAKETKNNLKENYNMDLTLMFNLQDSFDKTKPNPNYPQNLYKYDIRDIDMKEWKEWMKSPFAITFKKTIQSLQMVGLFIMVIPAADPGISLELMYDPSKWGTDNFYMYKLWDQIENIAKNIKIRTNNDFLVNENRIKASTLKEWIGKPKNDTLKKKDPTFYQYLKYKFNILGNIASNKHNISKDILTQVEFIKVVSGTTRSDAIIEIEFKGTKFNVPLNQILLKYDESTKEKKLSSMATQTKYSAVRFVKAQALQSRYRTSNAGDGPRAAVYLDETSIRYLRPFTKQDIEEENPNINRLFYKSPSKNDIFKDTFMNLKNLNMGTDNSLISSYKIDEFDQVILFSSNNIVSTTRITQPDYFDEKKIKTDDKNNSPAGNPGTAPAPTTAPTTAPTPDPASPNIKISDIYIELTTKQDTSREILGISKLKTQKIIVKELCYFNINNILLKVELSPPPDKKNPTRYLYLHNNLIIRHYLMNNINKLCISKEEYDNQKKNNQKKIISNNSTFLYNFPYNTNIKYDDHLYKYIFLYAKINENYKYVKIRILNKYTIDIDELEKDIDPKTVPESDTPKVEIHISSTYDENDSNMTEIKINRIDWKYIEKYIINRFKSPDSFIHLTTDKDTSNKKIISGGIDPLPDTSAQPVSTVEKQNTQGYNLLFKNSVLNNMTNILVIDSNFIDI